MSTPPRCTSVICSQARAAPRVGCRLMLEVSSMLCSNCGKEICKAYWLRRYAWSYFCAECFLLEDSEMNPVIQRNEVAHLLRAARAVSRISARELHDKLAGTGIRRKK